MGWDKFWANFLQTHLVTLHWTQSWIGINLQLQTRNSRMLFPAKKNFKLILGCHTFPNKCPDLHEYQ
jgi:hypothetical protein